MEMKPMEQPGGKSRRKPRVLFVDDESPNLVIVRTTFRRELDVTTATSGAEAIELLSRAEEPFSVIVTDQRMPGMTGVDLLARVRESWPDTVRMVVTAYTDVEVIVDAINRGEAFKFIYKPWEKQELLNTILSAVETYELRTRNRALTEDLMRHERLATVGKLVSGLAHEIGNQLAVAGISEAILARSNADEDLARQVRIIRNALDMIHRMVTEIRDFTQSRNRDLTLDTVDLEDVVGQAINLLHYDKDVKNVHLDLVSGPGILARVHRGKIQQVVINLVKNAAQAIPREKDGTVVVTVIARAGRAWIQVSDDGEGIREEILEKIWQPFFSTKGDRGTGLGLDVCRQIVEAHQGTMEVHSRCGEGTTFQVALPLVSLDEPADPTAPPLAV